jgi:hypothetical protein
LILGQRRIWVRRGKHHGRRPRRRRWPQSALTRVISVEREHSRQSCGVESKVHETARRIRCPFQPK